MIQSAEQGHFGNLADALNNSMDRCIFAQREVGPHLIVIVAVAAQHPAQVSFAEDYHVVHALAPD